MMMLDLNGAWQMKRTDETEWMDAVVPGSVYNDLLNAGKMEDPFYRCNEKQATVLSEYDYEYLKYFEAGEEILELSQVVLRCEGLDTIAEICLNGETLGKTMNMHRTYEFDVKDRLIYGTNKLHIVFRSPLAYIKHINSERPIWSCNAVPGFPHLRKAHFMLGWDWGPVLPDMGIWRSISIHGYPSGRIEDVYITQVHQEEKVNLDVRVSIEKQPPLQQEIIVSVYTPDGNKISRQIAALKCEEHIYIDIENPELWWPNGYGGQPLYQVEVVLAAVGNELDSKSFRIGLRTMTIREKDDEWGKSFGFQVNGIDIFAMGSNYIPEDNILSRRSKDKAEKLIKDCIAANFNCIRVWGGAIYFEDYFYDLCDEYGLIVWQDLMFACAAYDFTDEFRENIVQETIQNMERIRHHASLGLWCGNNEVEWALVGWGIKSTPKSRADYIKQFELVLPDIAKKADPNTFYWRASPSSFGGFDEPNDDNYGDVHDYGVWIGRMPFTDFRKRCPRFVSEFGVQAFPSLKTINTFTLPEDRNALSYVMEYHQKSITGIERNIYYIAQHFRVPKDFNSFIYVSQLVQAEGIRCGVEHWRRNRGRCMGTIYWQLNDCWPVISWSSIDYYGRWKALHYAAKRFFAPILVSACEEGIKVSLHVTNDSLEDISAKLVWRLCDAHSTAIMQAEKQVSVKALSAMECERLDFADVMESDEKKMNHYLEYMLVTGEQVVSSGSVLFVPARFFNFVPPELKAEVEEEEDKFIIHMNAMAFAKSVELEIAEVDAVFDDNYFDLSAGYEKRVLLQKGNISGNVTLKEIKEQLKVRSLVDSYE
jgi:beta-mannosidase